MPRLSDASEEAAGYDGAVVAADGTANGAAAGEEAGRVFAVTDTTPLLRLSAAAPFVRLSDVGLRATVPVQQQLVRLYVLRRAGCYSLLNDGTDEPLRRCPASMLDPAAPANETVRLLHHADRVLVPVAALLTFTPDEKAAWLRLRRVQFRWRVLLTLLRLPQLWRERKQRLWATTFARRPEPEVAASGGSVPAVLFTTISRTVFDD